MSSYWTDRDIKQRIRLLDKSIETLEKETALQYQKVAKKLKKRIEDLYKDILIKTANDNLLVSDLYKYNRYYDLLNNINAEIDKLKDKQVKGFSKSMENLYRENSKLLSKQMNLSNAVRPDLVNQAVNSVWCSDGINWSSRIWKNTEMLKDKLETSLTDAVSTGRSVDRLSKEIMKDFGVSFSNSKRLIVTELAHIQNVSTADKYKEEGITKYRILAEGDACDICLELAEQEFDIEEIVIPAHPNCRCCMVPVIER